MSKKYINSAQIVVINLMAQDIVCGSPNVETDPNTSFDDESGVCAPTRNYRGIEKGYEDEEW